MNTKLSSLPLLAGVMLATSAHAQTASTGSAPSTADFVKQVATSDMLEIQAGQLAEQNGNAREKSFGRQMVKDHTKTHTC